MSNNLKILASSLLNEGWSVRRIARELAHTVPDIHSAMGCRDGRECTGQACQMGYYNGKRHSKTGSKEG